MPDVNPLADRGRALEDEYFRRVERESLVKAQRTTVRDKERRELEELSGLAPAAVEALQAHGFTAETIVLLPLVPLIQIAWAEGGISDMERAIITQFARERSIVHGTSADQQLGAWLADPPRTEVFTGTSRLVGFMLEGTGSVVDGLTAHTLLEYGERIAAASGGFFGLGRIGVGERELLDQIARDFKSGASDHGTPSVSCPSVA